MSTVHIDVPYELRRRGVIMEPDPDDPHEAWGVLNPATARGRDGALYLFPRVVAEGNYSRIGIARVVFDDTDQPKAVERLGYALEPEETYEWSEHSHGGVEDPRITYVEPLGQWVMAYTAVSSLGPRIALAISDDLFEWRRLGLLEFEISRGTDFGRYGNKDGMFFPDVVHDQAGKPVLAVLHRPNYLVHRPDGTVGLDPPIGVHDIRAGIWISYVDLQAAVDDVKCLVRTYGHELVAVPEYDWEALKIGGGTPPVRTSSGWLTFYHGVSGVESDDPVIPKDVHYVAGAMILGTERPTEIVYRSQRPVLQPEATHEKEGIVHNVVFPTGLDEPADGRVDVYYGMADCRIGVATTHVDGLVKPGMRQ